MPPPLNTPGVNHRGRVATLELLGRLQPALRDQNRAEIVTIVRRLVGLRPELGEQWLSLAQIAAANGEVTRAHEGMALFLQSQGGSPAAQRRMVSMLMNLGAWDEALALLRTLPEDLPDSAAYAYSRGVAALYIGETDEARRYLERAIDLKPSAGSPWLAIASLIDFASEPQFMERITAAERAVEDAATSERVAYLYAFGKALDDNDEHARAFAAFARGAEIMKATIGYSRERDEFTATDAVAGYDARAIAALAGRQTEPTDRAIFVLGLPRTGTTLVEQVLTGHSAVSDGGEIYRLPLLVKDIGGLSYDAVAEYAQATGVDQAARLWSHWLAERFPADGRVVDKSLNTSRLLGLAATLLPGAPLIWMTRDPLDCAWSCFRRRFAGEAAWSYDFADIAFHFRLEDQLLVRWQDILGGRLLVVPYEGLATEPEPWIRRILAHCGLPEEPKPFAPHENRRTVTTSSVMQVRRPINQAAIGSAASYREYMEPFEAAYYR